MQASSSLDRFRGRECSDVLSGAAQVSSKVSELQGVKAACWDPAAATLFTANKLATERPGAHRSSHRDMWVALIKLNDRACIVIQAQSAARALAAVPANSAHKNVWRAEYAVQLPPPTAKLVVQADGEQLDVAIVRVDCIATKRRWSRAHRIGLVD
jgi:hypothetical protein